MTNSAMMFEAPEEDQASGGNLAALLPVILWQRKWWIIIPTIIGIVAAIAAIILIPPTYRSNAIMLVESPQLPSEVIGLEGVDVVDRRIARIRQQVTARPAMIALIEQHGLYASERRSDPLSKVIDEMRDAITLVPTQASVPGG